MKKPAADVDRRRYPRARAPILVRPVSFLTNVITRRVNDVSLGGLRAYSDEQHRPGKRLEMELLFPDGEKAVVLVEVVWVDELPAGGPARYDVGMRFVMAGEEDLARIRRMLAKT